MGATAAVALSGASTRRRATSGTAAAWAGAALALVAAPTRARAQQAPPMVIAAPPSPSTAGLDTVTLRSGVVLRGTVAEIDPQTQVRLVMPDGTSRVIAWADVASASGPAFSPPAAAPATTIRLVVRGPDPVTEPLREPHSADDWTTTPEPGRVPITLESTGDSLDVAALADPVSASRCSTPCTLYAPAGRGVRIRTTFALREFYRFAAGSPRRPSPTAVASIHEFPAPWAGGLRVRIRPPAIWRTVAGAVTATFGAGGVLVSGMLALMGSFASTPEQQHVDTTALVAGLAGAALLGLGIGVAVTGSSAIESMTPTGAAPPRLALGAFVAPSPSGATAGAVLRF